MVIVLALDMLIFYFVAILSALLLSLYSYARKRRFSFKHLNLLVAIIGTGEVLMSMGGQRHTVLTRTLGISIFWLVYYLIKRFAKLR
jgi:hypothetical protein